MVNQFVNGTGRPGKPDAAAKGPHDPGDYLKETYIKGLRFHRTRFTFHTEQWQAQAESRLSAESRGYLGNAGSGETARKNREAFARYSFIGRRLVGGTGMPDLSTRVLGHDLRFPMALGPVGVQRIFQPEGELASAAAAAQEGVPFIMSSASSTSIEDVAAANGDGVRWFQLYWPANKHNHLTLSILDRAKKAGFSALVVTIDTFTVGWRQDDMDNGYSPFLRGDNHGVAIGLSDPTFQAQWKAAHGTEIENDLKKAAPAWTQTVFPGVGHTWEDIKFLQQHWDGPIVLKGIHCVEDAVKAVEIGVQGIVVSNHGGREEDGLASSLGMLPRIVDAVGDKLDVLFDSGIRCGGDVAKALALGAKMCLVARPYIWGLVLGGKEGVSHVIRSLLGEFELTLHSSGIASTRTEHLNRSVIVKESELF